MTRQMTRLTDRETGKADGWFDQRATQKTWDEGTWHDGNNLISLATGSQWNHETLHLTRMGCWVISCDSQWQGTASSAYRVSLSEAADWLLKNEHADVADDDALSPQIRAALRAESAQSER